MFRISKQPLEEQNLRADLCHDAAGGFVCFEGWVRDHNEGRQVDQLEYEAYAPLAEKEGLRIIEEALEQFDILAANCIHRVGSLKIGEMAVWVGVSSAHRGAAFDACRYIIDEVKQRVPVWKKEFYSDGRIEWVNCATGEKKAVL